MTVDFGSDQLAFRDLVRELLARECPPARVRAAWEPTGEDVAKLAVWPHLARTGVVGMTAPERWGGLGLDERDLVLVLEESGRAALPEPLLEHTAVAIPLLAETASDALCDRWLGAAAAGRALITVGLAGAPFVVDAARAQLLLLEHDGELHAVERSAVSLTATPSVDRARPLHRVTWTPTAGTRVKPDAREALDLAFDRGAVGAAAQLLGLSRALIHTTVEYAKVRTQFGRAIGSFQAIKHILADCYTRQEIARATVYAAGATLDDPTVGSVARAVATAKLIAGDVALKNARACIQVHGGMGYTWEVPAHYYLKRVWVLENAFGDGAEHAEQLAEIIAAD